MTDNIGIKIDGNIELADKLEDLILNILNTSAGDSVKEKALDILSEAFPKTGYNTISNVHIQMPQPERVEYARQDYEDTNEDTDQDNLDEEEYY